MSLQILGNNNFENVPLIDTSEGIWAEGVNRCDSLLQDLAAIGLSALCYGVQRSPNSEGLLDTISFEDLFDDSGIFIGDDLHRHVGVYSGSPFSYVEHFSAGVHITEAALAVSHLFRTHQSEVINEDYAGATGVPFIKRRVTLPVPRDRAVAAGETMNTYPVRNIQARVRTPEKPDAEGPQIELDLAAALFGVGVLPWSATASLTGIVHTDKRIVQASVTCGERQGDFVRGDRYSNFSVLSNYVSVMSGKRDDR